MPTFRFHRGTLQESLKTCKVVNTKRELFDYIWGFNKVTDEMAKDSDPVVISSNVSSPANIKILPYVFDERIGWNTHIVLIDGCCITKDPYPIGFLSDNLPEDKNEIPNS